MHLGRQDPLDQPAELALLDLQEVLEQQVIKAHLGRQDPLGLQEIRERSVILALQDLREQLALKVLPEPQEAQV